VGAAQANELADSDSRDSTDTDAQSDSLRLIPVTDAAVTNTYTYDPVGNRLTLNAVEYTYDDADQMLTADDVEYGYDDNGNQTSRGSDTFDYDHEDRLTEAVIGEATSTYAYDGDGLRMSRTAGGATTNYVWDVNAGLPVILQDSLDNSYVYGLDLISATDGTGDRTYFLYDGLGSTTDLADEDGTVTGTYAYDAFGPVRAHTGASTEWSYTGEQNDPTGLEYLRARYYDPAVGRFLTQDPLASIQQYAYVGNSPPNFTDPLGLDCGLTHPWECKGVPIPTWPVPGEWPDIPLPRFDPGNPIEHAKEWGQYVGERLPNPTENWDEWWDWVTRSNKTQRAENPYHPSRYLGPPSPPQMPYPRGPGDFRLPQCNMFPSPYKQMCWAVGGAGLLWALDQLGLDDVILDLLGGKE